MKKINQEKIEERLIEEAGAILKNGGLVAFPTETVYGLGADAMSEIGAQKTYEAKGRPSDNPLIVHIANWEALDKIVKKIPRKAQLVAEVFWPGALTMIFEKSDCVPYGTTGGLETVAVRMPDHPIANALILAGGGYISAPSANASGRPSPTRASHVWDDLNGKIDMILDAGQVEIGVESTILDVTVDPPMILRPGAITKEMIEKVIGEVQVDQALLNHESKEAPKAPGMKYRHYAPKAKMILVEGEKKKVIAYINEQAKESQKQGFEVGIIGTQETLHEYVGGIVKSIGTRGDSDSIAHNLYQVLRAFDEENVKYIYSESFEECGLGAAIMNRMMKAAGNTVIDANGRMEFKLQEDEK